MHGNIASRLQTITALFAALRWCAGVAGARAEHVAEHKRYFQIIDPFCLDGFYPKNYTLAVAVRTQIFGREIRLPAPRAVFHVGALNTKPALVVSIHGV